MFYKKAKNNINNKSIALVIDDFSKGLNFNIAENILNSNYSVNSYNFSYNSGALTESYGFQALTHPSTTGPNAVYNIPLMPLNQDDMQIYSIFYFKQYHYLNLDRRDKYIIYGATKQIYFSKMIDPYPSIDGNNIYTFEEAPFTMNYKINGHDYICMCSESDGIVVWDCIAFPAKLNSAPNASSMCYHNGRIYATVDGDRSYIRYTANAEMTDSSWATSSLDANGGKIQFNDNSKVNRVVSFLGYLYAFKDFGITKINSYKNSVDFDVTDVVKSGNKIYEKTISVCGDKIFMLTKDGIASFNGISSTVLNIGVNKLFNVATNCYANSCFHAGKYYLACRLNFNDEESVGCEALEDVEIKNNALIVLDVENLKYEIVRGVDICCLTSLQFETMDKVAICMNNWKVNQLIEINNKGAFYNNILKKVWDSPLTDLGYSDKIKVIKSFSVLSYTDCKVTVYSEKDKKSFLVKGAKTVNKFKVGLKGKQIGVKIECESSKCYISNLKLDIDLLDYAYSIL